MIRYIGKRPLPKKIDMSGDPACVEAHHGNALDESLVVSSRGGLANVQAARSWYSDEPGPTDLRDPIRSRTVFTHGADQPGVEP